MTNKKSNAAIAIAALIALSGCAHVSAPTPLDAQHAQRLSGQTITPTKAETPSFVAMTPTKAAFGMLGAFAAISEGSELVKTQGIEDPAVQISNALTASFADKYKLEIKPAPDEVVGESVDQIIGASIPTDVIMDVRTLGWSMGYFPASWGSYYVAYGARARLIDAKTKSILAEGTCGTPTPEKTEQSPGYDELVGNGAQGLKKELASFADQCVERLLSDMQM